MISDVYHEKGQGTCDRSGLKSKDNEELSNAFSQGKKESTMKVKLGLLTHNVLVDL